MKLIKTILIVLSMIAISTSSSFTEILQKPICTYPFDVDVLSPNSLKALTEWRYGEDYPFFISPADVAVINGPGNSNVSYLITLDDIDHRIRCFDLWLDEYLDPDYIDYGGCYGTKEGWNLPNAVSVDCDDYDDPNSQYIVYVADSGNDRIEKIDFNIFSEDRFTHELFLGAGILNNPLDVEFCDLPGEDNDCIVVADTDNNRIVILDESGNLIQAYGTQGSGKGNFNNPSGVTARRVNDVPGSKALYIYVSDSGNKRIVWLVRNDAGAISWGNFHVTESLSENIACDPICYGGVYYTLRAARKLVYLSYDIDNVIDIKADIYNPTGISVSDNELVVISPYMSDEGIRVFEVQPEIRDAIVSPTVFSPPLEWVKVLFSVTTAGYITIEVLDDTEVIRQIALDDYVVADQYEYYWDGRKDDETIPAPKQYVIKLTYEQYNSSLTDIVTLPVDLDTDNHLVMLGNMTSPLSPQWSPGGTELVLSDSIPGTNYTGIYVYDIDSATKTLLTEDTYSALQPSWAQDGQEVVWVKEEGNPGSQYVIHAVDINTNAIRRVSQDLQYIWEENPKYSPDDIRISYISPAFEFGKLYSIDSQDGSDKQLVIDQTEINIHDWSPFGDQIVYTSGIEALNSSVYKYDLITQEEIQLTHQTDSGGENSWEEQVAWSGSGMELIYSTYNYEGISWNWNIYLMDIDGTNKRPISGLRAQDVGLGYNIDISPDNTKIVFPVFTSILNPNISDLIIADLKKGYDAYPSCSLSLALVNAVVSGTVNIFGTIKDNVSVDDVTNLSELNDYQLFYTKGKTPDSWSNTNIELKVDCSGGDCEIENGLLGIWHTGKLEPGEYIIKLVVTDGEDENSVLRAVTLQHNTWTVKPDGTGDFTIIQDALDEAAEGDTVAVSAGEYVENLVIPEGINLIGVDPGVRVIGQNGTSISIIDHDYSCTIRNIAIENDNYYVSARGVYISNSSPQIKNCSIKNQGYANSGYGCGVAIYGNSFPYFSNCEISENKGSFGAGIQLQASMDMYPAPEFYNCEFCANEADHHGGAVYLNYDYTPLDCSKKQPLFRNCRFRNNASGTTGSAIYLGCCYAPTFDYCEFSGNHNLHGWGMPVYGTYSGARFDNCTLVNNDAEAGQAVLVFDSMSQIGFGAVKIHNCIFSDNLEAAIINTSEYYEVINSCFYNNLSGDNDWLSVGEGNVVVNPAFSDIQNGVYTLFPFSPCSPHKSEKGLIGAYNIVGIPLESVLIVVNDDDIDGCPQGDDEGLDIDLSFTDISIFTRTILKEEIQLVKLTGTGDADFYYCEDGIIADSDLDSGNAFTTSFTADYVRGWGLSDYRIYMCGEPIGTTIELMVRNRDYNDDGIVNLIDFAFFGPAYNKHCGDPGYIECFDYRFDPEVCQIDLSDLIFFNTHYQHFYSDICGNSMLPQIKSSDWLSEINPVFVLNKYEDVSEVEVYLENAFNFRYLCLEICPGEYEFEEWIPDEGFPNHAVAMPVPRNDVTNIFVQTFGEITINSEIVRLGVLKLKQRAEKDIALKTQSEVGSGIGLIGGEVLSDEGKILLVTDIEINEQNNGPKATILYNAFPNPFNPSTTIKYSIASKTPVKLSIYNANGQLIRTLVDENQKQNSYSIVWEGRDNEGQRVSSGVYFYRLVTNDYSSSKKLILIR